MSRSRVIFWLAVAFQILVVVTMVARKQWLLQYGRTVVLLTTPNDPYALFRGNYAQLRYEINTIEVPDFQPWPVKRGQVVYAELAASTTSWFAVGLTPTLPVSIAPDHIVLRGKVQHGFDWEGRLVLALQDVTEPGWLATQADTATWRMTWQGNGQRPGFVYSGKLPEGATVYIALNSFGGSDQWNQNGIFETVDDANKSGGQQARTMVLQGIVGPLEKHKSINIEFGIETYYLSETVARTLGRRRFRVEVAVNDKGEGTIKSATLLPTESAPELTQVPAISVIPSSATSQTPVPPPAAQAKPLFDDEAIWRALNSSDPATKQGAVQTLATLPTGQQTFSPRFIKALARELKTPGEDRNWMIVNILRAQKAAEKEVVAFLMDRIKNGTPAERRTYIQKLASYPAHTETAASILLTDLSSPITDKRRSAMSLIGSFPTKKAQAMPFLIEALRDTDLGVRSHAARALSEFRAVEAIPALKKAAEDPRTNTQAITAALLELRRIQKSVQYQQPLPQSAGRSAGASTVFDDEATWQAFNSTDPVMKQAAIQTLATLPGWNPPLSPRFIGALVREMKKPDASRSVLNILSSRRAAEKEVVAFLKDNIDNGTIGRPDVIENLSMYPSQSETAAALVLKDFSSPSAENRRYAMYLIARFPAKKQQAMPFLLKALSDSDESTRGHAAQTLSRFGAVEAIPALKKAASDPARNTAQITRALLDLQQKEKSAAQR